MQALNAQALLSLHRPRQLVEFGRALGESDAANGLGRQAKAKFVSRSAAYTAITRSRQDSCSRVALHIVAPIFHGSNSSSPMPRASDFVFWPEAVFMISSNIF